ncbi:MAG: hypothetical protein KGR48_00815 [Alphaproteobacteria bacterium]|nr:hypothetical protein [Alphaproteobacteria bacterium]MDE2074229.1 hypothetical protein [Alphaproteobacteria bacterium]MDE2352239.1 hypothetical protein [Alphaproteobacteria bacterium]
MPSAIGIAGDITGAATALAGLILVFLGAISTAFEGYQKTEKSAVRSKFKLRAWIAFVGFVLALLAAALSLIGKWLVLECAVISALGLLFVSLILILFAALSAVREIK